MKTKVFSLPIIAAMLVACSQQKTDNLTLSGLDPDNFKAEVKGKPTALYVLENGNGMEACITNYGGRLVSLMVPDRNGEMQDVVLGHDSIADYVNIDGNFGAIIGRYGNRIAQGRFTLNDSTYQLPQNNFGHCLHGGPVGFHHAVWDAVQPDDSTLVLTLFSPDGEAGFPGNVNVKVTYSLSSDNAFVINYEADTDKPTILNLTNHSYFNLSGNPANDILSEFVYINAEGFTPIDSTFMTNGQISPVDGTPFDFRTRKPVGRDIDADDIQIQNGRGYDHNFVLATNGDINEKAASVSDPNSGITMDVYTDQPGIQFYVGNFIDGKVKGKKGVAYPRRAAMCLETQHYPNSPNFPQWPSVTVNPGEKYSGTTIYKFSRHD